MVCSPRLRHDGRRPRRWLRKLDINVNTTSWKDNSWDTFSYFSISLLQNIRLRREVGVGEKKTYFYFDIFIKDMAHLDLTLWWGNYQLSWLGLVRRSENGLVNTPIRLTTSLTAQTLSRTWNTAVGRLRCRKWRKETAMRVACGPWK